MKNFIIGGVVSAASIVGLSCEPATIGGTEVPAGLVCEEDELIQFVTIDTLDCIHIDDFVNAELERRARIAERQVND